MTLDPSTDLGSYETRELFAVRLLTTLSDVLETAVGHDDAEGFIAIVAHQVGRDLSNSLRHGSSRGALDLHELAEALVTVKRRIDGGFRVVELTPNRIVLENDRCPFGRAVRGRQSLCRMTSGVFGRIAADNLGFANVAIPRAIATGHDMCRVEIDLLRDRPDRGIGGIDYFADPIFGHAEAEVAHVAA